MSDLKVPQEGWRFNPLTRYRNIPCPCGSKKKAKRCHGQFEVLPEKEALAAQVYLEHLRKYGFVK